jgi:hypothetical protein
MDARVHARAGLPLLLLDFSICARCQLAYGGIPRGYVPGSAITPGGWYDVRFLEDRLVVVACTQAEVPYGEVEDVEIGGPGLVKTGGGYVGGGFGATAAIEGMAIAAVLNALTTRTSRPSPDLSPFRTSGLTRTPCGC